MASTFEALLLAQMTLMQNPPQARLHQVASQPLANNTMVAVTFDASDNDNYNGHSTSVNPSRYVFQVAGTYTLLGGASSSASTAGFRQVAFRANGTTTYKKIQAAPSPSFETALETAVTLPFNVGDYVELTTWHNAGVALSTVTTDQSTWPWMDVYRISS